MILRLFRGEVLLAAIFAALGIVWIAGAVRMQMWEGFAPQSGFLPLIYGVLLTVLSLIVLGWLLLNDGGAAEPDDAIAKPVKVLATLLAAVLGIGVLGFAISVFLLLLFLYAVIERLPPPIALLVSGLSTAALYVVFKIWLGVPLPPSPFGIL